MKKIVWVLLAGIFIAGPMPVARADEDQIVIEDLSRAQLRAEIDKIQKEFYRVFNAANDDDKLDIICHRYLPTGSNIRKEACEPQFVIDRRGENAANWQQQIELLLSGSELQADLEIEFQTLAAAINAVAMENQYFRELRTILRVLQARLEEITN